MTPWTVALQASLSVTNSQSLFKPMSLESVMPSNHLILCHPLFLLTSIFPSIRVFSNESALRIRWPKHWSFSFSISPSNEYSGLISFRMDCLGLLAGQGTLKSLLQHHSSKASIIWRSAFFLVQLSHPYMTTEKAIALTRWTFFGKAMSLLFNMLSRLVIAFLPRSKCPLISWLQSLSAMILEPKKPIRPRFSSLRLQLQWRWTTAPTSLSLGMCPWNEGQRFPSVVQMGTKAEILPGKFPQGSFFSLYFLFLVKNESLFLTLLTARMKY